MDSALSPSESLEHKVKGLVEFAETNAEALFALHPASDMGMWVSFSASEGQAGFNLEQYFILKSLGDFAYRTARLVAWSNKTSRRTRPSS